MPAPRVCTQPGCPTLVTTGRCRDHARQTDAARGRRQTRGYDTEHDKLRREWTPRVASGRVRCWRCQQPITPGTPWDLGHHDDRTHAGPEHRRCNRSAAGRAAHTQ